MGSRDHSTVLHSITAIEQNMKHDKELASTIRKIEEELDIK